MSFNMNRTWSQATTLVGSNFQLLAVIAGVFLLLPSVVLYIAMPDLFSMGAAGSDPDRMAEMLSGVIGQLAFFGILAFLLQVIGYGAMIALVGGERPTVGESIKRGLKSLPSAVGAAILFVIAYVVVVMLLALVVTAVAAALGGASGESGVAVVISFVLFAALFVGILYAMTRLSLTLAVIVLERVGNPITAMVRSWRLTRPHAWSIVGFYLLLLIAYLVISILLLGISGVVGAAFGEGIGAILFLGIVNGLLGAGVAMLYSAILASMHGQLAGQSPAEISDTFE